MSSDDAVHFTDVTFRDGSQSLWGLRLSYHMIEPVMGEVAEAGYKSIELSTFFATMLVGVRYFKEDPRILHKMISEKLGDTSSNISLVSLGTQISVSKPSENQTACRLYYEQYKEWIPQINQGAVLMCTQDEVKRSAPIIFPMWRKLGIEPIPYLAIGHGARHTPAFYADVTAELVEKYQPKQITLEDASGLLTPERFRLIYSAVRDAAKGTPIELHAHGMNGLHNYNMVVGMEMGMRHFATCIPPLANNSSHPSIFDVANNVEQMGLKHNMDLDKLRIVEERLKKAGAAYGNPVDNPPLPFNLFDYKHQIPGGVISNTRVQLEELGMGDQLTEVLEEIPRILEDLGHPVMATPFSQFIATQAALNVQLGRWEHVLDACVDLAAGLFGIEDPGINEMKPEIKEMLLSQPSAQNALKKAARVTEYMNSTPSEAECKAEVGLPPDASREEYVLQYQLGEELAGCTPNGPDSYQRYL